MSNPAPTSALQALTPEESRSLADALRELHRAPGWLTYLSLIRSQQAMAKDQALEGEVEHIPFWRGYIAGLESVMTLSQEVVSLDESETKKADIREETRRARRLNNEGSTTF